MSSQTFPSSMADSYPPFATGPVTMGNSINRNSRNNYTRFVGKLLFFTFFLIVIPLLPSQAPDFINQTILNKFWEPLHHLFIGIAVSYGLFGRRNVDNANLDDSQSYVSRMFHVSSIFEDGFDHSMYYSGQGKGGFFNVKNSSFENPYEENVVQSWSYKYFQGEPMVVSAQPNCGVKIYSESDLYVDYKPLGLPVRSLKSRVQSRGRPEFANGSSVEDSSDGSDMIRNGRFVDLGSEILEGKLNDNSVLGSPIPWRSRSGRKRERVHGSASRSSHFRPLSIDETQFESFRTRSLRATVSFSSQVSSQSQSHSPSSLSPSHSSSSESPKSIMNELAKERSPRLSIPPTSPPIPKPTSNRASTRTSHSRQFSDGSLLGKHGRKCYEDELKEFHDTRNDDSSNGEQWVQDSLKFDAKPAASSIASSRGKSVRTFRTFRAHGKMIGRKEAGEKDEDHLKGKLAVASNEVKESYIDKSEPQVEGVDNLSVGFRGQNYSGRFYMPKPTSPQNLGGQCYRLKSTSPENLGGHCYRPKSTSPAKLGGHYNRPKSTSPENLGGNCSMPKLNPNLDKEKQECSENSALEAGENSERANEDFHTSSDEETMSGTFSVAGSDAFEVDKKAGEFIAKFREQIRLQRTTSTDTDTPRGIDITGNFFR